MRIGGIHTLDKILCDQCVCLTHRVTVQQQHTVSISCVLKAHIERMHSVAIQLVL